MDESPTEIAAALGIDGSGHAHIAYSENPVLYATNASGSWSIESLEPEAGAHSPSLAVSKDGVVHVAFVQDATIRYLHNEGGAWATESIAEGEWPSIAVDSAGSVHVSFARERSSYYATNSNGQWEFKDLAAAHSVVYEYCNPTAITVDANDQPHILYTGSTWHDLIVLYYLGRVEHGWIANVVDYMGESYSCPADYPAIDITADSAGLHTSYIAWGGEWQHAQPYDLKYSMGVVTPCDTARWQESIIIERSETVPSGISTAVGLDPWGGVHVSYYTQEVFDEGEPLGWTLRHASNAEGAWATESVDTECAVPAQGRDTLAVGADGVVHLVYHARDQALKYAMREYTGDRSGGLDESQPRTDETDGDCSGPLTFSSAALCEAVWDAVGNPEDEILSSDMASLAHLVVTGASSLEGIECLPALSSLDISNSPGLDVAPLAILTNLTSLRLSDSQIVDIPTPTTALTNLTSLDLHDNRIADVAPLASLTNLTTLDLGGNLVADVAPLVSLTNLTTLDLQRNRSVVDVAPLASLTNLTTLDLQRNLVADVAPLASLTNLTTLALQRNLVADVAPLASLTNLTTLDLQSNSVVDVAPLASLTNLMTLDLGDNLVADVAPLASLTNLTTLGLTGNQITNIAPLASLTNLTTLDLSGNQITNIAPLLAAENLRFLDLLRNPLDCASQLPYLDELVARGVDVMANC